MFYLSRGKQTKAGSKRKRQGIWKRKRKKRSSRVAILLRPEKPRGKGALEHLDGQTRMFGQQFPTLAEIFHPEKAPGSIKKQVTSLPTSTLPEFFLHGDRFHLCEISHMPPCLALPWVWSMRQSFWVRTNADSTFLGWFYFIPAGPQHQDSVPSPATHIPHVCLWLHLTEANNAHISTEVQ